MIKLFHPFLVLIASATDRELANYVRYLKEENRILCDQLPRQIKTKPFERARLMKFGLPLGRAIDGLITIVTPGTFRRWIRQARRSRPTAPKGRPGISRICRFVRQI